ncbi:hypothetical protein GQ43DRAFT_190367 [Delitschia confertaspora ATCC 74209]|uniref:DNA/RNA-binding domain-containing protein n=1 Tax=Delitschia confertaspora ATCC 74209 TaxID=1513339 RepID=A0A9P4JGD2_9PLEO|nr:hypothetical protein GQ43DRAFT_190367 [Delitschia confertaspora ATCC 74209]
MATNTEQLARRAFAIEKELGKLAEMNAPVLEQVNLLQEFRGACENVIFSDFGFASAQNIEARLWGAHTHINTLFRKQLRQVRLLRRNGKNHVVELRKSSKHYLAFIKTSQRFYRQFIMNLDAQFDGIPELRKVAQKWKDDATKPSSRKKIPSNLRQQVLLSCHQTLIQLGDLSRYRETELVEKERNWGPAIGYYGLAAEIYPISGQSHNQQAVIAREDGNHFRSTYHLYRSLASKEPHPQAKPNLELEFKKIISAWQKGELVSNHKSSDGKTTSPALLAWFIRLHSKCYKGQEFAQHEELENEVLSQLAIELKERSLDSVLQKIILINLAAEYFATVQMQGPNPPENIFRTYFYYLRLNVRTFFTLLQILQPELERVTDGENVTDSSGSKGSPSPEKITAVARRILPGLRLYSIWFTRYWNVLNANIADTLTKVEIQELWKAYAETLTLLAMTFPSEELPQDDYMLEEDVETIGFQPLFCEETKKTWYHEGVMKRKWSDEGRSHPNIEMRMRVRDLLIDGLLLTQNQEAPLDLDGLRFIYREAGLPSELLASPNNRPDGSPVVPVEAMDMPLFPQEMPVTDDQKSHSVAPSESASTALAKDSAMNRMVDDLLGPDDGLLDPLPEEDEILPPTPPEQTFEDTTMVGETTYGMEPLSISDLVNAVQNGSMLKTSPRSPAFSTPMNRVMSSSSIRQPANLPSLPDGQSNGKSIWNRDYDGTPGPSSPHVANGYMARGSPLIAPNPNGHFRADSSLSAAASDWTGPSATPLMPQYSGGFGNGAGWGSPNASYYGSIYGNNFHRAQPDVGMASPLLFGKGSWGSHLERGYSSYGRTPPHGQGG